MPGVIPGSKIETDELCSYGCGQRASYKNKQNKLMCSDFASKCPENRRKNSERAKEVYSSGKRTPAKEAYRALPASTKRNMAWAKGLSKETDLRILKQSKAISGRRKITDEERLKKLLYVEQCQFNLAICIDRVRGYNLLLENGMYHRHKNANGVVRDHRISVDYGFKHNIDPKIISHPANCEFILHKLNAKKTFKNSCTLEQLLEDIKEWDREGNWHTLLVESQ